MSEQPRSIYQQNKNIFRKRDYATQNKLVNFNPIQENIKKNSKYNNKNTLVELKQKKVGLKIGHSRVEILRHAKLRRHTIRMVKTQKQDYGQIYLNDMKRSLEIAIQNKMIVDFLKQIKTNDFNPLIGLLKELKEKQDYAEIRRISDYLDKSLQMEKLTIDTPLRKIKIEDFQQDLFKIKFLVSKLIHGKGDEELKQELNKKLKDIIEKFESQATLKKALDELGINEKELEKEIKESRLEL